MKAATSTMIYHLIVSSEIRRDLLKSIKGSSHFNCVTEIEIRGGGHVE